MAVAKFERFFASPRAVVGASPWPSHGASRSSIPGVKNPATSHWERAFRIFDLLL
jgi:hypothetical protein